MMNDLFNERKWVIGNTYNVCEINAKEASEIVKKYHYSGKVVPNSQLHLGVFLADKLVGCLSFGPPMNGKKTSEKISSTHHNMYELNRMVMDNDQPRNSESQAISLCLKYVKRFTDIDYILSFSDGKEGNVGYIYQATNWLYGGFMLSDSFYMIDGEYVHSVTVWHKYKEKHYLRDSHTTNEIVCIEHSDVSTVVCKQHIYLFPIKRKVKFNIDTSKNYPKKENEQEVLRVKHLKINNIAVNVVNDFHKFPIIDAFGRKIK